MPANNGQRPDQAVAPPRTELHWLGVVRHGESTGNVIASAAEQDGVELIDIPERDADVPLSDTGREQAQTVGRWLAELPADQRPDVVVVSTYLRARQTAELACEGSGLQPVADERLRDRELGVLDLLTGHGVRTRLPAESDRRSRLGKFYYRPPGGESWTDVLLRLRSLRRDLRDEYPGGRVLLVAHEAIVLLMRYLLEGLSEAELMAVVRETTIANCSVSSWRCVDGVWRPELFNAVEHLKREGAPATKQEDVHAEPV
jgi:probable phosphoglycerate mutase